MWQSNTNPIQHSWMSIMLDKFPVSGTSKYYNARLFCLVPFFNQHLHNKSDGVLPLSFQPAHFLVNRPREGFECDSLLSSQLKQLKIIWIACADGTAGGDIIHLIVRTPPPKTLETPGVGTLQGGPTFSSAGPLSRQLSLSSTWILCTGLTPRFFVYILVIAGKRLQNYTHRCM